MKHRNLLLALGLSFGVANAKDCVAGGSANSNCDITITRDAPSSPLTFSMAGGAIATVRVQKGPLEKVVFNSKSSQGPTPDPLAAIFNTFSPLLKGFALSTVTTVGPSQNKHLVALDAIIDKTKSVKSELNWILGQQNGLKTQLDGLKKDLDSAGQDIKALQNLPAGTWSASDFQSRQKALACEITSAGSGGGCIPQGVGVRLPPAGLIQGLDEALKTAIKDFAALAQTLPATLQDQASDAVDDAINSQADYRLAQSAVDAALTASDAATRDAADAKTASDAASKDANDAKIDADRAKADNETAQVRAQAPGASAALKSDAAAKAILVQSKAADAAAKAASAQLKASDAATKDALKQLKANELATAQAAVDPAKAKADDAQKTAVAARTAASGPSPDLAEVEAALNTVASNQGQLDASLKSIQDAQTSIIGVATTIQGLNNPSPVDAAPYQSGALAGSRTTTVTISVKDLVSGTLTDLGTTVTITWGSSTSWEVSLGTLFSPLASRSFSTVPIVVNGQAQLDSNGKTIAQVAETISRPELVPMALAHYRVKEWAVADKNAAFLITGGFGVSPYSTLADFAAGVTFRYRQLMISPVAHFGHDVRLTNGVYLGEPLGSSPPALPTQRYWVKKLAIAITIRVPVK